MNKYGINNKNDIPRIKKQAEVELASIDPNKPLP